MDLRIRSNKPLRDKVHLAPGLRIEGYWVGVPTRNLEETKPETHRTGSQYRALRRDDLTEARTEPPPNPRYTPAVTTSESSPFATYSAALATYETSSRDLRARDRLLSSLRLGLAAATIVMAWVALAQELFGARWIFVPIVLFVAVAILHERAVRARARADRAARFYSRGMERLEDRWTGRGEPGTRFVDDHHPYASDLDLFGSGSLFERLCTARSPAGQETLAAWLLAGAEPREIRLRQEAVLELRDEVALREKLFVATDEVGSAIDSSSLRQWALRPRALPSGLLRFASLALAVMTSMAVLLSIPSVLRLLISSTHPEMALAVSESARPWLFGTMVVLLLAEGLLAAFLRAATVEALGAIERSSDQLALLSTILKCIEGKEFQSRKLASIQDSLRGQESLRAAGRPASHRIAGLVKIVDLLESRRNPFFAPFGALLLWTTNLAFAIEKWRAENGEEAGRWLDAVGSFEALSSLASFAYERPDTVVPEIRDGESTFEARELGHPLLPGSRVVRNDVAMGPEAHLLIVSGSNMSGKSTMLRTIGSNGVLALAGSLVCARSMSISPLRIGASIRLHDSLQEGTSRFYAEISRLRQIVDLASGPLLFLLDEILHGTNSHDRRIGAEAILRTLVQKGAIGLVTTHDLALAKIGDSLGTQVINVHFEDHLEHGKMMFDYRMRPGVVDKSNALELMRAVGLKV